ncbi:MAG: hypothetical protein EPN17_18005 [Methylobacter sp.]|nr:MAG: hypothetical protein EPN17_18005 [Methylobacter sp.]
MKKLFLLIQLIAIAILFSPLSYADEDDEWEHHHGHGWHHHHYPRTEIRYYYPQPVIRYVYPQPPPVRYVYPQPPPVRYYPQPARYPSYDQRSHQGLAGGVIGSVFGYELGSGDPIATGLGAAAGSFLGNGIGGGYPRAR